MGRQHSGRNLWLRSLHTSFVRVRVGLLWSFCKHIILCPEYEVLDGLRLSSAGLPLVSPHYCCSVSSIHPPLMTCVTQIPGAMTRQGFVIQASTDLHMHMIEESDVGLSLAFLTRRVLRRLDRAELPQPHFRCGAGPVDKMLQVNLVPHGYALSSVTTCRVVLYPALAWYESIFGCTPIEEVSQRQGQINLCTFYHCHCYHPRTTSHYS